MIAASPTSRAEDTLWRPGGWAISEREYRRCEDFARQALHVGPPVLSGWSPGSRTPGKRREGDWL